MDSYVTYDADGNLTGAFLQDLRDDHLLMHIRVDDYLRMNWALYRANADRTGLELAPVIPPAPAVAESVPMLNLQLILIEDGKLATVQAILDGMTGADGAKAQAYWSKALTARRDNYLVAQLWPAIGYDEAGFNDAWSRAAALNP